MPALFTAANRSATTARPTEAAMRSSSPLEPAHHIPRSPLTAHALLNPWLELASSSRSATDYAPLLANQRASSTLRP